MSLNNYLLFFLKSEVITYERDTYFREKCHYIPREKWKDYTMIDSCKCENEGQDALYGNGRRVFNKTSKEATYRCTSCATDVRKDGGKLKGKK